jgi:hypothetical protein
MYDFPLTIQGANADLHEGKSSEDVLKVVGERELA